MEIHEQVKRSGERVSRLVSCLRDCLRRVGAYLVEGYDSGQTLQVGVSPEGLVEGERSIGIEASRPEWTKSATVRILVE